jgi:hypothetical protein
MVDGLADANVGAVGGTQPPPDIERPSKAHALLTVVTAASRKMVIEVPVGVALKLKGTNDVLVVPALAVVGLVIPPEVLTLTDAVAEDELVR